MKNTVNNVLLYLIALAFLSACGEKDKKASTTTTEEVTGSAFEIEKPQLTFGFIKLTDMAPLAIAKEKGFFEEEGLFVSVEAQSNWKNVLDRVIDGQLDGSHMLAGQPIAAGVGFGRRAKLVTPFSMDLNGNGITVSNDVWAKMKPNVPLDDNGKTIHPIKADALKPVVAEYKNSGKPFKMGMVFPVSTHNYEIRYWLAAAGIHPGMYTADNVQGQIDAEVLLSVTPPPQMPATLESGTIYGYCVGEPWNQQAVFKGIGVPVVTNYDIWKNNPEKVFVMTKKFVDENPNTAVAVTKALIRAGKWLDNPNNRKEAVKILSMSQYVGAPEEVLANSMTGTFEFEKGDKRSMPDFNVFYKYNATYPFYSDGIWFLTQMRRWGQISEAKPAAWYKETIKEIYRPDVWRKAADLLVAEGKIPKQDIPDTDGYKPATTDFIDGTLYDAKDPIGYINSFSIGNKD
ncbi:CmpA/NrtA family ABC transporter substrate-binding protein [Cellulophaga lytica]|uniref:ABC-type nitrate/sulfonate/taurine/bicarbonate transporter, substrate binding protein n=1 Tax=Cellulophaga lytica (strain ATCC 23178 / DSM 7489 / JCM 8516 / NBRC 14961 / NCIMB 1423 / VKM B-1433 / Cy l20) TaxID=867900 RepID=F0RBV3_CELLC|nr:ABC transporter substrate-binding protein [Cellulophaga lytica]ADY28569.1 ABC-type nitrate/sulfonate/taurine/bicarbonate transporter, substrate binding protein [Cellulophaga lytica DSM 7489]AIM59622.1 nitrate ABC transporter substrate-binding protein [Cellulophaga lytica]APU09483.1 nitrate ABC transporter substrate-binding protein [Cellulophaga lytica]WQG77253.1 CmpA/NrtA family ABC transporter substrate-binding protein [Cellulophaga lytica]SNQ44756.1 Nitrate-specific BPD transport protein,